MYVVIEYLYRDIDPTPGKAIAKFTNQIDAEYFIAPFIFRRAMLAHDSELVEYEDGDILDYTIRNVDDDSIYDVPSNPVGQLGWAEEMVDDKIRMIPKDVKD